MKISQDILLSISNVNQHTIYFLSVRRRLPIVHCVIDLFIFLCPVITFDGAGEESTLWPFELLLAWRPAPTDLWTTTPHSALKMNTHTHIHTHTCTTKTNTHTHTYTHRYTQDSVCVVYVLLIVVAGQSFVSSQRKKLREVVLKDLLMYWRRCVSFTIIYSK